MESVALLVLVHLQRGDKHHPTTLKAFMLPKCGFLVHRYINSCTLISLFFFQLLGFFIL